MIPKPRAAFKLSELKLNIDDELKKSLAKMRRGSTELFRSKRLDEAIVYAFTSGGKRLRPLMVLAAALSADRDKRSTIEQIMPGALAVEYVHTYSLIHDDLPAMDDDDFRRGRPSLHQRFDQGLAILAGDALLADAFYHAASSRNNGQKICRELAQTAGSSGLAAGQAEDLNPLNKNAGADRWLSINGAKTARLYQACAVIGGLSVNASQAELKALRAFGRCFGRAFQIKDDIDDRAGIDARMGKPMLERLIASDVEQALTVAKSFGHRSLLVELVHLTFASCLSPTPLSNITPKI